MTSREIKGSKNKLLLNEKVQATPDLVNWYARHLCWSFGTPVKGDTAYNPGEKEIQISDLCKVYVWALAQISGKCPKGVVGHYGADDSSNSDRKNVWVRFTFPTELGPIRYDCYVNEKDLKSLKRKRKKK